MAEDGRLLIGNNPTGLSVRKTDTGLSINSYVYPLKRNTNLRTGSVKGMLESVMGEVDKIENELSEQVNENLFLMSYKNYPFMRKAFVDARSNFSKKGY
jgi:hypothetical protein